MLYKVTTLQAVLMGSLSASATASAGYGAAQFAAMRNFIAIQNRKRITEKGEISTNSGDNKRNVNQTNDKKTVSKKKEDSDSDEDPDNPELVVDHYIQRAQQILERQKSRSKVKPLTSPSRFNKKSEMDGKNGGKSSEKSNFHLDFSFGRIMDDGFLRLLGGKSRDFLENVWSLDLTENELSIHSIKVILDVKSCFKNLEKLVLNQNELGEEGILVLSDYLEQNSTLKILEIAKNRIGVKGIEKILSTLCNSNVSKLQTLNLSGNVIPKKNVVNWNSGVLLSVSDSLLRMKAITSLDLSFNGIGQLSFKHLHDMIQQSLHSDPQKRNSSLRKLNLCSCDLEYGLAFIPGFITAFSSLEEIHLGSNQKPSASSSSGLLSNSSSSSSGLSKSDNRENRANLESSKDSKEEEKLPFELPSVLLKNFTFGIVSLDLSCNELGSKPSLSTHILKLISSSENLAVIDLSHNFLGFDSELCFNLARELSGKKRLKSLDLSENELETYEFNEMLKILCNGGNQSRNASPYRLRSSSMFVGSSDSPHSPTFLRNSVDSPSRSSNPPSLCIESLNFEWESPQNSPIVSRNSTPYKTQSTESLNSSLNESNLLGRKGIRLHNLIAARNRISMIESETLWDLLWTLRVLNLNQNELCDEGTFEIAQSILQHKETNLRNRFGLAELHLASNGIGKDLIKEIQDVFGGEILLDFEDNINT